MKSNNEVLRSIRSIHRLKLIEIAKITGASISTVSCWLRDRHNMSQDYLDKLTKVYNDKEEDTIAIMFDKMMEATNERLQPSRERSIMLTKLEEAYFWFSRCN